MFYNKSLTQQLSSKHEQVTYPWKVLPDISSVDLSKPPKRRENLFCFHQTPCALTQDVWVAATIQDMGKNFFFS